MKFAFVLRIVALAGAHESVLAGDLSPGNWPKPEREQLERLESQTWWPLQAQTVAGAGGLVSATVSPIAVYAGTQTLKQGGNAADAAATVALTQISTQLGSVVSYAGVFTMLYYDTKTHKVYSLDAGYNTYINETDSKSIPVSDLGALNAGRKPTEGGAKGRETLVPGFMAGVEAMHQRFGRLPFRDLFEPALWYSEHGVTISPALQGYFAWRQKFLSRTLEGRQFMGQSGRDMPVAGDVFKQPALASTLKAVAQQGSRYMYTGQWARDFVATVQREGGKATREDLERYRPIWSEPYKETVFGHTVYVNGPPHFGAHNLFAGLNLSEALKLDRRGPYWTDPETFQSLSRINRVTMGAPLVNTEITYLLRSKGIDASPDLMLSKRYARAIAPLIDRNLATPAVIEPKHSNAIVVVDRAGNIAAATHTINTVIWGDTGIVVGGIPIPDSAGFQQLRLAALTPGTRLPHEIIDTIIFEGDKPVLATAGIGASLVPETVRVLFSVLGQRQSIATVMAAPPLLSAFGVDQNQSVSIPQGAYEGEFVAELKRGGMDISEVLATTSNALRGTLAAVAIDPETGKRTAVNQPGVMVFNAAD